MHRTQRACTSLVSARAPGAACQSSYLTSHKNSSGPFSGTKANTSSRKLQKSPQMFIKLRRAARRKRCSPVKL